MLIFLNMWERAHTLRLNAVCCRISSRLHVRVLWWTPERRENRVTNTVGVQPWASSISKHISSSRTFSCSEEDKRSELDSPPGMQNWGWLPWVCLNTENSIVFRLYTQTQIHEHALSILGQKHWPGSAWLLLWEFSDWLSVWEHLLPSGEEISSWKTEKSSQINERH